jgi:hypothetical protein
MVAELNAMDRQLTQYAQPLPTDVARIISRSIQRTRIAKGVMGRLSGKVGSDANVQALAKLRRLHPELDGADREALSRVIDTMERKQSSLQRARRHVRYKSLLELWLYVHVPVTFLLLALLTAHIVSVFFYW